MLIRNPKVMSRITVLKQVLSFGILGLLMVVFAGNGLRIEHTSSEVKMRGLWYGMKCTTDKECVAKFLKSMYDEGDIYKYEYYWEVIPCQVKVTISLFLAGVLALIHTLPSAMAKNEGRTRPFNTTLAFIIGGLTLGVCSLEGTRQIIYQIHTYNGYLQFPWTLFLLALAGGMSVVLGTINVFINDHEIPTHDNNTWKPFPSLVEFIIMITSSILQVVIHAGAGISIFDEHTNILLLTETRHNHGIQTGITTMLGVWYVKIINGTHSTVMSRFDYIASLNLPKSNRDLHYGLTALFVVTMTTIAIGTIIATSLYGVTLHKREGHFLYKVRNFMLTCLVISGTVGLDMTASIAAGVLIGSPYYTNLFTRGLCFLGLSSVLDLVVAGFNVFVIYKQICRSGDQQTFKVPLSNMLEQ